jgi:hypothetical protein
MIAYLPYTHIPMERLEVMCTILPGLIIYQPFASGTAIEERIRHLVGQQKLNIRWPQELNGRRLEDVIREFDAWADMHRKGLGDIKAFYIAHQGRPPLVEDTSPSQIEGQIRRFGQPSSLPQGNESLFRAALFISLAHRLDEQQEVLETELGTIQQMEQRMFSNLTGDDLDDGSHENRFYQPAVALDRGTPSAEDEFIKERIQSWATLAADDAQTAWAYVTTNRLALDEMLEYFPENVPLIHGGLQQRQPGGMDGAMCQIDLTGILRQLAFSKPFPDSDVLGGLDWPITMETTKQIQVELYGIPGCTPRQALNRMRQDKAVSDKNGLEVSPAHTVVCLVNGI